MFYNTVPTICTERLTGFGGARGTAGGARINSRFLCQEKQFNVRFGKKNYFIRHYIISNNNTVVEQAHCLSILATSHNNTKSHKHIIRQATCDHIMRLSCYMKKTLQIANTLHMSSTCIYVTHVSLSHYNLC